jgi:hypothetical protein
MCYGCTCTYCSTCNVVSPTTIPTHVHVWCHTYTHTHACCFTNNNINTRTCIHTMWYHIYTHMHVASPTTILLVCVYLYACMYLYMIDLHLQYIHIHMYICYLVTPIIINKRRSIYSVFGWYCDLQNNRDSFQRVSSSKLAQKTVETVERSPNYFASRSMLILYMHLNAYTSVYNRPTKAPQT